MQLVLGAGLVRPAQPPGRQGPSYARVPTCPEGYTLLLIDGQYQCQLMLALDVALIEARPISLADAVRGTIDADAAASE